MDERQLAELSRACGLPGLSFAMSRGNDHSTWAAGWADCESREPLTPGHRFLAGSVGKTFTASSALMLEAEGALDLDAPIFEYLPDEPWRHRLPAAEIATVRMLLAHRSGIPDHRRTRGFAQAIRSELSATPPNFDLYFEPDRLVGFILNERPAFPPGTDYAYSETGYILAGMIIERAARMPLYDLISSRLHAPLGLSDTLAAASRELPGLCQGYVEPNEVGFPQRSLRAGRLAFNPATEWAGGGWASTPADLAKWIAALHAGNVIGERFLQEMRDFRPTGDSGVGYGLGCYRWTTASGPVFGHTGEAPGYRAIAAWRPGAGCGLAIATNSSRQPPSVMPELLNQVCDRMD